MTVESEQTSTKPNDVEMKPAMPGNSPLSDVINFFQKTPEAEKDCEPGIFHFGDVVYFPLTEASKLNDMLSDEFRKEIIEEMMDWEEYMYCKEYEETKKPPNEIYVPVRNQGCSNIKIQTLPKRYRNNLHNDEFIKTYSSCYKYPEFWDLEMDETPGTSRQRLALEQKTRGNQYFTEKKYEEANECYSKSISLLPSSDSYNNRALTNLKLKNYIGALRDANEALRIDPSNEKAMYRRVTARKEMGMYEEALREIENSTAMHKTFLNLRNDIKSAMSKLNGKKYNIRGHFGAKKSFTVDISQLPIYASCDQIYLLEVDKTGCQRSCVCDYCTEEDLRNRNRSSALRIRERERWKVLTTGLLSEMNIVPNVLNEENTITSRNSSSIVNGDGDVHEKVNSKRETPSISKTKSSDRSTIPVTSANSLKLAKTNEIDKIAKINSFEKFTAFLNNVKCDTNVSISRVSEELTSFLKTYDSFMLKNIFQSYVDRKCFTIVLRSVLEDFQLGKQWQSIYHILTALAGVKKFKEIIKSIDENTQNNLRNMLDEAVMMKLLKAEDVKDMYF